MGEWEGWSTTDLPGCNRTPPAPSTAGDMQSEVTDADDLCVLEVWRKECNKHRRQAAPDTAYQ